MGGATQSAEIPMAPAQKDTELVASIVFLAVGDKLRLFVFRIAAIYTCVTGVL